MKRNIERINRLEQNSALPREELRALLETHSNEDSAHLFARARAVRESVYGKAVYLRGLIELSSFCKNDCLYCGIRRGNQNAQRYRLTEKEILACCQNGYSLGFRTFVLQGGEDAYFSDERMEPLVRRIRTEYPDCAITLSLGERSRRSYETLFAAGADRYLLRHETANAAHYAALHPPELQLQPRLDCLRTLKEIGYQVGCGFMVGSPGQTTDCLLDDLAFLKDFQPHMVGIGPFLPHRDTPFAKEAPGTLEQTLFMLGLLRLLLPEALLPATTALGTVHHNGRELGLLAGANVVMPNLSPVAVRKKYMLYDNKICTGEEAAECRFCLQRRVENAGYEIVSERGDHIRRQTAKIRSKE
ncbi:MAG: [FeFe] hydrogenase H-cluster radical SAM maturase HydE [Oscillospiraceae bacterium]|jgi:biotin synthase|nr:[FeFe] hydrogenase H-cluster radical SAM maturase HydE [Oscillospiraceae bacterium]